MILQFLKEHTKEIHRKVEKVNPASKILDHSITLEQYKNLIVYNYQAYFQLEKALVDAKQLLASCMLDKYATYDKSSLLIRDINECKATFNAEENVSKPFSILTSHQAIGVLYVVEGSMLGGMMIAKHLGQCEDLKTIEHHYFFGDDSRNKLDEWKSFCDVLNSHTFSQYEMTDALKGADKAFKVFEV